MASIEQETLHPPVSPSSASPTFDENENVINDEFSSFHFRFMEVKHENDILREEKRQLLNEKLHLERIQKQNIENKKCELNTDYIMILRNKTKECIEFLHQLKKNQIILYESLMAIDKRYNELKTIILNGVLKEDDIKKFGIKIKNIFEKCSKDNSEIKNLNKTVIDCKNDLMSIAKSIEELNTKQEIKNEICCIRTTVATQTDEEKINDSLNKNKPNLLAYDTEKEMSSADDNKNENGSDEDMNCKIRFLLAQNNILNTKIKELQKQTNDGKVDRNPPIKSIRKQNKVINFLEADNNDDNLSDNDDDDDLGGWESSSSNFTVQSILKNTEHYKRHQTAKKKYLGIGVGDKDGKDVKCSFGFGATGRQPILPLPPQPSLSTSSTITTKKRINFAETVKVRAIGRPRQLSVSSTIIDDLVSTNDGSNETKK